MIKGKVVSDFDFKTIDVVYVERQRIIEDERYPNIDKQSLSLVAKLSDGLLT